MSYVIFDLLELSGRSFARRLCSLYGHTDSVLDLQTQSKSFHTLLDSPHLKPTTWGEGIPWSGSETIPALLTESVLLMSPSKWHPDSKFIKICFLLNTSLDKEINIWRNVAALFVGFLGCIQTKTPGVSGEPYIETGTNTRGTVYGRKFIHDSAQTIGEILTPRLENEATQGRLL